MAKIPPTLHIVRRLNASIAYRTAGLALGAAYFHASNFTPAAITTNATDSARGYSLFGSVQIAATVRHCSRVPGRQEHHLGLVYKYEMLADHTTAFKTRDIGVWAQVRF